jgi:hypothetical protein
MSLEFGDLTEVMIGAGIEVIESLVPGFLSRSMKTRWSPNCASAALTLPPAQFEDLRLRDFAVHEVP